MTMTEQPPQISESWHLDKRFPIALIFTLVIQTIIGLSYGSWLVSKYDSRMSAVESAQQAYQATYDKNKLDNEADGRKVGERLASLETQSKNQTDSLRRIEDILIRSKK